MAKKKAGKKKAAKKGKKRVTKKKRPVGSFTNNDQ